jgi:hypothetical protein
MMLILLAFSCVQLAKNFADPMTPTPFSRQVPSCSEKLDAPQAADVLPELYEHAPRGHFRGGTIYCPIEIWRKRGNWSTNCPALLGVTPGRFRQPGRLHRLQFFSTPFAYTSP